MKRLLLSLAVLTAPLLHAQTHFTYQGKLENSGAPFTGNVHIRLALHSTASGGSAIRTEVMPNILVTNGIFTVMPATFTAADFPGANRWLNIEVSGDGGANYTALTPRQQVTWTPYALHAATAASAATATTVSGNVPAAQITGTGAMNPGVIGTGFIAGSVTFNPASGPPFNVNGNTTKVPNLNSDLFDGLDSAAFLQRAGGTMTGPLGIANSTVLNFGNQARQMMNLYNTDYGIGVQANTLYQRSASRFSWYAGGLHSDLENSGNGGVPLATMTSAGLELRPGQPNSGAQLTIGDSSSSTNQPYIYLREPTGEDDTLEISARRVRMTTQYPSIPAAITFGAAAGQHLVLFENNFDVYGLGVQTNTLYFRTGEQFAWYKDGTHTDSQGLPGLGGSAVMTLSGRGTLTARGPDSGFNLINRNNTSQEWALYSRDSGGTGQFAIWNNGTGDVAAFSPNGDMYLTGQVSATVLTVRGGADVAEPFEMTKPDEMEPGTVVVIDDANPGHLMKSTQACDTRVAGIISGAGGVKPGLRLHQEGVMEGDHHVALSGRVYVKADAAFGKIKPGDLLTTSTNAGHAMKVKDHDKAQGAILGKAMSKLDKGTGLVLVLVTLQ